MCLLLVSPVLEEKQKHSSITKNVYHPDSESFRSPADTLQEKSIEYYGIIEYIILFAIFMDIDINVCHARGYQKNLVNIPSGLRRISLSQLFKQFMGNHFFIVPRISSFHLDRFISSLT